MVISRNFLTCTLGANELLLIPKDRQQHVLKARRVIGARMRIYIIFTHSGRESVAGSTRVKLNQ